MLHTKPGVADTFIKAVSEETAIILKDPNAKVGGIVSTSINGIFPHYSETTAKMTIFDFRQKEFYLCDKMFLKIFLLLVELYYFQDGHMGKLH